MGFFDIDYAALQQSVATPPAPPPDGEIFDDELIARIKAGDEAEAKKARDEDEAAAKKARDEDEAGIAAIQESCLREHYAQHIEENEALSAKTLQTYKAARDKFAKWCAEQGNAEAGTLPPRHLPTRPTTLATYLHEQLVAGTSRSQLKIIAAAVSRAHLVAGFSDPANELVMAVLRAALMKSKAKKKLNGAAHHG